MKSMLVAALSLFVSVAAFAEPPQTGKDMSTSPATHERQVDDPSNGGQPCQNDYQDPSGGYTEGGCNCGRICYDNTSLCDPSISNNGCQAGAYGALWSSCGSRCNY